MRVNCLKVTFEKMSAKSASIAERPADVWHAWQGDDGAIGEARADGTGIMIQKRRGVHAVIIKHSCTCARRVAVASAGREKDGQCGE